MKKTIIALLALLCGFMTTAKPIDVGTARRVAVNYLKTTEKGAINLTADNLSDITSETPFQNLYIFNLGNRGFVLVSADDCALPILGYSLSTPFPTGKIPYHVLDWINAYEKQITEMREMGILPSPSVSAEWDRLFQGWKEPDINTSAVEPLLTSTWSQSPYYNRLCPFDSRYNTLTVVGCVATAMGQIMKYWQWPISGTGSTSYSYSSYGTLSANFDTTYDWNNIPDALTSSSTSTEINATALLNYHCGVAVHMQYGPSSTGGSGAYVTGGRNLHSSGYALTNHFKYNAREVLKYNYSDSAWKVMLKNDLDNHRPILYGGSGSYGGHAFVCDGYNTSELFHFNWGWGGSYNGYYAIGSLNPGRYTYNSSVRAVVGITPARCTYAPAYDFAITPSDRWSTHSSSISDSCWNIYKVRVTPGGIYSFKTCCGDGAESYNTEILLYDSIGNVIIDENDYYSYEPSTLKEYTATDSGYIYLKVKKSYGSNNYTLAYRWGLYNEISVESSPQYGGWVEGDGRQERGSTCTLYAYPNDGFAFSHWSCRGTTLSTNPEYSFTVTSDDSITAHFIYSPNCVITAGHLPDTETFSGVQVIWGTNAEEDHSYFLPPCWSYHTDTGISCQGLVSATLDWNDYNYDNNILEMSSPNCDNPSSAVYAVLPPTDSTVYPVSTLQVSFLTRNPNSTAAYVEIGVMTDPDDMNTFSAIERVDIDPSVDYTYHIVPLQDYHGPHGRIAFKVPPHGFQLYFDDVVIAEIPPCPAVQNLLADNVTPTSADISWTETGTASSWTVQYNPTESDESPLSIATHRTAATLAGLRPNTQYTVQVKPVCTNDEGGINYITFRTGCADITALPYVYDFEDADARYDAPFAYCLTNLSGDGIDGLGVQPGGNHTPNGSKSLYFSNYGYPADTNNNYQIVALPRLETSILPVNTLQFSLWIRPSNNIPPLFVVGVMTDPNDAATFVPVESVSVGTEQVWQKISVPLLSYTGQGEYVAILARCSSSAWYASIDDLSLEPIPSCVSPHHVFASNNSIYSIELDWDDLTPAAEWQIEYGPAGYSRGSEQGTLLTTTSHPVTIRNLDTLTAYDFYVRSICSSGDSGEWLAPVTLNTSVCNNSHIFAIGSPLSAFSSEKAPVDNSYRYSLTQTIIDSTEIAGPADIASLAYYFDYTTSSTYKTNCTIYFQPTDKSFYSNTSDMVPLNASAVKVYTGPFNCHNGWNIFPLDTIYHYNGHGNLLIIVDDNSGSYNSSYYKFKTQPCSENKTIYYYSDSSNPDPSSPSTSGGYRYMSAWRPVMQLIQCLDNADTCTLTIPYTDNFDSYTTSTTAKTGVAPDCWTLVHQDVAMTDEYKPMIYHSTSNAHSGSYSLIINKRGIYAMPPVDTNVNTLQLSFWLKQPYKKYRLQVGVINNPDDPSTFVPLTTLDNTSTSAPVQHTINFSSYSGSGRNIAFRNILAPGYSGDFSCNYIDDLTLSFITPACSLSVADLPYTDNFDSYTTATTAKTGIEPPCWTLAHQDVSMTSEYQPMIYHNPATAHSGNYSLIINKRGIYAMPDYNGDITNLRLQFYLAQPKAKYRLQVGVMSDLDNPATFTPIDTLDNSSTTASILHTVDFSSYTGNGHYIAFRNTLAPGYSGDFSCNYIDDLRLSERCTIYPDDLPYTDNFDSYTTSTTAKTGVEPPCWALAHQYVTMADEYKPMVYRNPSTAHSGSYSLILNKRGIYAMPYYGGGVNSLRLQFYLTQTKTKYRLQVGVMTDLGNPDSFVPVATFNNTSTTAPVLRTVDFSSYTGTGHYIAFRNTLASGYTGDFSCNYIDDINLVLSGSKALAADQPDQENPSASQHRLVLYPNPTTGVLNLEADDEIVRVDVFDYTGRRAATVEGRSSLDLSPFASGIYTLRITLADRVEVRRIVKQ